MGINSDYRIKTTVCKSTYETLVNDMVVFEIISDDTINKSGFVNLLFQNYHPIYDEKIANYILGFDKTISNSLVNRLRKYDIPQNDIHKIEKDLNERYIQFIKKTLSYNNEELTKKISFKINKPNQNDFDDIIFNTLLPEDTIASYFRGLFDSYAHLPQDIRETIIFRTTYNKIMLGIRQKRKIGVKINNEYTLCLPYRFAQTIEENNNYLIGIKENNDFSKEVVTFKLCKIQDIVITNDEFIYNKEDEKTIDNIIDNGAQFAYTQSVEIKVRLSKKGIKMYKRFPANRPKLLRIENENFYVFSCSPEQIYVYFFPFSSDALIVEPSSLKNRFINGYEEALKEYKK